MFLLMGALGIIAYIFIAIILLEKVEKVERKSVNMILVVSAIGFGVLYGSAYLLNSLFHSIEQKRIILGGITWLGGVLVAFPAMVLLIHFLCPRIKGNALLYFNLLVPAIVVGHALGRIGCFCGGCCYGGITDSFLGVRFPPGSLAAKSHHASGLIGGNDWSLPVFPTQLLEAGVELILFSVMMIFYKKLKEHFFETYCFGYGAARFALEFLRDDNRGSTGFFLTPSQLMSIILVLYGVLLILYHKRILFKGLHKKMQTYREETLVYGAHLQAETKFAVWQLETLKKDGLLTESEYADMKDLLLSRLKEKPQTEALLPSAKAEEKEE